MKDLTGLLELMKMTHEFRTIERVIHMRNSDRLENDMEHSFQLALCGWYVITTDKLPLDVNKVIRYALLHDLDDYLRTIWLECCGHMSTFTLGGWGTPQLAKEGFVGDVFRHRAKLMHVYDFGTESWTTLKRISVRRGQPATRRPISLMVRNKLPEVVCLECGAPAGWLCMECVVEEERMGFLCARHRKSHPHDNYGAPLKVVNSPRLGLCGYTGPAKPPY